MTKTRLLTLLLGAALVGSCGDSAVKVISGPEPGAGTRIRFFNFGVGAPGVYFYANDTKVTALSATGFTADSKGVSTGSGTESVTGTTYGNVSSGGYYASIAPGSYKFNGRISAVVDNGLQVAAVTQTLDPAKKYSFYMSGFYNTTAKTVESFIVEDPYSETYDWSQSFVRFVNAISNAQPMILYAKNQTTGVEVPIGGAIAYKSAGVFTPLPGATTYDLSTRLAGSSTNILTRTNVSFSNGKIYTITARGDITVASSNSSSGKTYLDNTANR